MDWRCEVRVPTYRRPELLERCLKSLIAQTHENWRAIVLDDSPEREGEAVLAAAAISISHFLKSRWLAAPTPVW